MTAVPEHTLIYYYVPEDRDDLAVPNAYLVRKPLAEVTLETIEETFPMAGSYTFRFKYSHGGNKVWLDLVKKSVPVPKYDNKIIMKVTRNVAKDQLA